MRIIEGKWSELSEDELAKIQQAINRGEQINSYTARDGNRQTSSRETCLTKFTDPFTGETRWAVEVWSGTRKWSRDFPDDSSALGYQRKEHDRLGI